MKSRDFETKQNMSKSTKSYDCGVFPLFVDVTLKRWALRELNIPKHNGVCR